MHACMHALTHAELEGHTHACMHARTHAELEGHTHAHMHACTHAHMLRMPSHTRGKSNIGKELIDTCKATALHVDIWFWLYWIHQSFWGSWHPNNTESTNSNILDLIVISLNISFFSQLKQGAGEMAQPFRSRTALAEDPGASQHLYWMAHL
jgi:hypothetical protein